jgi:hypothetical protein
MASAVAFRLVGKSRHAMAPVTNHRVVIRNARNLGNQLKDIHKKKYKGECDRKNVRGSPQRDWRCGRQQISAPAHRAKNRQQATGKDAEEKRVNRTKSESPFGSANLGLRFALPHRVRSNENSTQFLGISREIPKIWA